MTARTPESSIEVFPTPDWAIVRESLERGFEEIFPDIGDEAIYAEWIKPDSTILGAKMKLVKSVGRIEIRNWFLSFFMPVLLEMHDHEPTEAEKTYAMEGDMEKIARYMTSAIRKDLPPEQQPLAQSNPLELLWSYIPQEQRDRIHREIRMSISQMPKSSADGQDGFSLEVISLAGCAGVEKRTAETVAFLLEHPVDWFDSYVRSLLVLGQTKDIMNKPYSERYLQHIRTVMVNRIWLDVYRAMQEPEKDWHFEYRESDLAHIIEETGSHGGGKVTEKLNELLKLAFPYINIALKIGNPHGWHAGEYNPPILIDIWSGNRREAQEREYAIQYVTAMQNGNGEWERQYHGVAVGGHQKEIGEFLEYRSAPLGVRR